jgi:hypothetical protein
MFVDHSIERDLRYTLGARITFISVISHQKYKESFEAFSSQTRIKIPTGFGTFFEINMP